MKSQIKSKYRRAGIFRVEGAEASSKLHRKRYFTRLPTTSRQKIMMNLYTCLDGIGHLQIAAREDMAALGRRYLEIKQFQRMPDMGVVGYHVFSAFIQIPHRFATKQKLWRYRQLSIIGRSSAGKPLASKRLDR